jgi:hypothetical protein
MPYLHPGQHPQLKVIHALMHPSELERELSNDGKEG